MNTKKLFAYADEAGQDKRSKVFVVGVLLVESKMEAEEWAIGLDRCKKSLKWHSTKYENKLEFLRRLRETSFKFFAYTYTWQKKEMDKNYQELFLEGIIHILKPVKAKQIILFLDGVTSKKVNRELGSYLRRSGAPVKKIRGVDDKKVPLIRIIDAIVGAVRDYKRGYRKELMDLVERLLKEGKIVIVK